ncbi:MAG: PD-(D/E)XK nuclease family protein [Spirochaetaceae bacterium]|jgi:hypothetical protein|nr:PD-(D/E)XK nuclease family protein [Spirochaetaceae bacterium]
MEQTLEKNAASLVNGVTNIVKYHETKDRESGRKFNLFHVAGIARKEVIMCRVLADLLDPQGKHCKGSLFLKLFWEVIAPKLRNCPALDIEHTRVTPEYVIDENRRIDITLEDGAIFVPLEVKIWAGDQPKQVADYFAYAQTKNKAAHIPVLYLTVDGHEPSDYSKADAGKDDYVCLSFKDDILSWLEACLREEATEKTVPVRENLKQLIAAIKSLCGKSEDAEMENEIFKLVTQSDDTGWAALAICNAADFDSKAREAFKGPITKLVARAWPAGAEYAQEDAWEFMWLSIKNGNYYLEINYLGWDVCIEAGDKAVTTKEEKNALYEKMSGLFSIRPKPDDDYVWCGNDLGWTSCARDDELYTFHLCKLYTERPQEVADKIIAIARELESVKV